MVPDCCWRGAGKLCTRMASTRQRHASRPVKPVAALLLLPDGRTAACARQFPGTHQVPTHIAARRSFLVRSRGSPARGRGVFVLIARRAASRRTEPHPNENRLVAPRAASGRLSRRRRRVPRGRRERWAKRTPAFTLLLQQRGELSNVRNVVNQSEAVVACQLLQKKRCPGGQSTRAALTAAS